MTNGGGIIGLADWLETPAGWYLLEWERRQIELQVANIFGFHSLQLGLPQLNGLQANRMPHRWYACDPVREPTDGPMNVNAEGVAATTSRTSLEEDATKGNRLLRQVATIDLHCEFDALPFDSRSLDLVLLPHALELARDPHLALSEVERVLVPEGKVVILGFNPASLWGLRQRVGRLLAHFGLHRREGLYLPTAGEFIAYKRLRDWLRLLSFEVEAGQFGCYRPPLRSEKWLSRYQWIESVGERWWPVFGSVYLLVAVKRVRGMRLVGLVRTQPVVPGAAPAAVISQQRRANRLPGRDGTES